MAIGLGVYIQSLPEGADVTVKTLTNRFAEGEITIRRALDELVVEGYLARHRIPLGGGRFATRIVSYDKPGCASPVRRAAASVAASVEPSVVSVEVAPEGVPDPEPAGLPADILARLRTVDSRLPADPPPPSVTDGAAPLITCDGCERAFRSRDPEAVCADCRLM
ncbi:hypothetical protein [Streptomyces stackebrandtii]|uniref:hypothetical protein n=1 Tax=Streptomyces stackebrandtii TaxID=3051177 RepID=UPI0028DC6AA7|nr:hypothetical protein [Streptomyces sp. DSM 40976]